MCPPIVTLFGAVLTIVAQQCESTLSVFESTACYGQGRCSRHELRCHADERLAIISAIHGFKRRKSLCPSLPISDCSFKPDFKFCCREDPVYDCVYPFRDIYLRELYERCSGGHNCTYYTDRVQDVCSLSTRTLSSYSVITYSCIPESHMVDFTQKRSARGHYVFPVFDPARFPSAPDRLLYFSCRLEPVGTAEQTNVTIIAVDVRLDQTSEGPCSSLLIRQNIKENQITNISCATSGNRTFLSSVQTIQTALAPVDLLLTLSGDNMPGYVWLLIESEQSELTLRCGSLEHGWVDVIPSASDKLMDAPGSRAVAAIAGGLVLLSLLAGLLAGVLWWKRRARITRYLQTIPLGSPCSKETVERRLLAHGQRCEMTSLEIQNNVNTSAETEEATDTHVYANDQNGGCGSSASAGQQKSADAANIETLQIRPSGQAATEPIYDRVKFVEKTPIKSGVGVYDHLRHVVVQQDDDEDYEPYTFGKVKIDEAFVDEATVESDEQSCTSESRDCEDTVKGGNCNDIVTESDTSSETQ